jgi:hypothetical protein
MNCLGDPVVQRQMGVHQHAAKIVATRTFDRLIFKADLGHRCGPGGRWKYRLQHTTSFPVTPGHWNREIVQFKTVATVSRGKVPDGS